MVAFLLQQPLQTANRLWQKTQADTKNKKMDTVKIKLEN
jgi:hypothetical protein